MAAWRYKISLLIFVLKYFLTRVGEEKFVSPSGHVMFSPIKKHQ